MTELKTSWGQTTDYQYDCFGRMTAVASNKLGTSGGTVRYAYDAATGRKSDVTRPNGVTTHYTYDAFGNVHIIDHYNGSTHLLTLTYTRDNRGIITALGESRDDGASVVDWTYSYDGAKRLTGADRDDGTDTVSWGYAYDDAGNRLTKSKTGDATVSYAYNEIGQMLSDGTTTYLYDAYGNLEYEKQGSEIERQYYWDGENHLLKVDLYASGSLVRTVAMSYDDQGGRVGRKQTAGATIEADNRYLTDYGNPTGYSQVLEQLDASATSAEKDFIYGADLLAQADSGGGLGYLLGDHLGSTRLLTDAAGGAITNTAFDFSPYGDPLGTPGSSLTDYPHAFTGQWRDDTLGMQFHRARWLKIEATAWCSVDSEFDWPSGLGSLNGYVGGDPTNRLDLLGTDLSETLYVAGEVGNLSLNGLNIYQVLNSWEEAFQSSSPEGFVSAGFWTLLLLIPGSALAKRIGSGFKVISGAVIVEMGEIFAKATPEMKAALQALKKAGNWRDAESFVGHIYQNLGMTEVAAQTNTLIAELGGRVTDWTVKFSNGTILAEIKHWSARFIESVAGDPKLKAKLMAQIEKDIALAQERALTQIDWHFTKEMIGEDLLKEIADKFAEKGLSLRVFRY